MPLRVALVVVSLVLCVSIARSYDSIKTVPVSTEKARISAYLASDRRYTPQVPPSILFSAQV